MINQDDFKTFLNYTSGQKEIPLIIAESDEELSSFQQLINADNFKTG